MTRLFLPFLPQVFRDFVDELVDRIEKEYSHLDGLGSIGQSVEVSQEWKPDKERSSRCCHGNPTTPTSTPANSSRALVGMANGDVSESLPGNKV